MNRLTRAAGTYAAQSFTYNPNSNRQAGIAYDGMGNDLTNAGYEDSGRLSTVSLPNSDTLRLYYNGHGELARTRLSHRDACNNEILLAREDFSFAPDGRALSVNTTNTVAVNGDYIWLDHLPVAQFQDSYDSTGTYIATETTYLHPDHLGTPRIGTDTARNITWRYRSDAFGIAALSGTATVRLRFPGQLNLGAEGFNYNYFRDYRPETGRYLESDPIGLIGGINTYGYVEQNPLAGIDPLGLETCVIVTTNSWGIRNHSALYMSQGDGAPFLFDPSGAYARSHGGGTGDWLEGDAANLKLFAEFHKPDRTEMTCQNTSAREEKRLVRRIVNEFGPPRIASCAINVSNVLTGSPYFPNVKPDTFWPGNLYRNAGGKP